MWLVYVALCVLVPFFIGYYMGRESNKDDK